MKKQSDMRARKRVALFHDRFRGIGGSEKLALMLASSIGCDVIAAEVEPSVIQKLGFNNVNIIALGETVRFPFMISAVWKKRFSECDFSSQYDFFIFSGNFSMYAAKRHVPNLWYCHTPPKLQYLPSFYKKTAYTLLMEAKNKLIKKQLIPPFLSEKFDYVFDFLPRFVAAIYREMKVGIEESPWRTLRAYTAYRKHRTSKYSDLTAVRAIDSIIVNSRHIQNKVRRHYGRESSVIYPPVDCSQFAYRTSGDFWLSVNRMIPTKRVEMQIGAFRTLPNESLIIVGECEEHHRKYSEKILKNMPLNVTYRGAVSEEELRTLYANCKGFITTAEDEDFGMTAIEAMAGGKPVIAPNEGGYKETILDGVTGILLDRIDEIKLAKAIEIVGASPEHYKDACIRHARQFDTAIFIQKIKKHIGI